MQCKNRYDLTDKIQITNWMHEFTLNQLNYSLSQAFYNAQ